LEGYEICITTYEIQIREPYMGNTLPLIIHIKTDVEGIVEVEVENSEGIKKLANLVEAKLFHRETSGRKR
jgi:hypothetical protein